MRRNPLLRSLIVSLMIAVSYGLSQADLSLTAQAPLAEVAPRQTVNLVLLAANRGDAQWSGQLQPELPTGWRLLIPPAQTTLAPGESATLVFTLLLPQDAEAGSYVIPVTVGEADPLAQFTLQVSAVAELEATLLRAPTLVVADTYTVVFLLSNSGNVGAQLMLSVEDNLGLGLDLELDEIALAAGESEEVEVRVSVPANLSRSEEHRLTLRAEAAGDIPESLSAQAEAIVDLIPLHSDPGSAYHSFPLRFRSSATIDLHELRGNTSAALERAQLEIAGTGKLWDTQPGTFRLELGTGLGSEQQRALLEYRAEEFGIRLGQQRVSPSPLFPDLAGTGLGAQAEVWPLDILRLGAEAFVLAAQGGSRYGGRAQLTLEEALRVSVQVTAGGGETLFGARWQVLPNPSRSPAGGGPGDLDVEYAARWLGAGDAGRALWLSGGVTVGPVELEAGFRALEAGYDDESWDRTSLSTKAAVAFGASFPSDLALIYRLDAEYLPGTLLSGPRALQRIDSRLDLLLDGSISSTELGLEYVHRNESSLGETARGQQGDTFTVSVATFLEADTQLQQRIGVKREAGTGFAEPRHAYSYVAGLRAPSAGGYLTNELDLSYSREERSFTKLELRTEWSGPLTPQLELIAGGKAGLVGDRIAELDVEGRYSPGADQRLTVDLRSSFYRSRSAQLRLGMSYSQPFDLPLGPLSTVGRVSGYVTDATGKPLERLVVRLAGRSAVTQGDGSFLFAAVPQGSHQLIVHAESLGRNRLTLPVTPLPVVVEAGSDLRIDLRVVEAARLRGKVEYTVPQGNDATVVYGLGRPEEESAWVRGILVELTNGETVLRDVTDEGGEFEFVRVPPGEWRLVASAARLSELYRLEPAEQTLDLLPGENSAVIELLPQARPIRFVEGGIVGGDGEEPTEEGDEGDE